MVARVATAVRAMAGTTGRATTMTMVTMTVMMEMTIDHPNS
jgi:hypothetical protein